MDKMINIAVAAAFIAARLQHPCPGINGCGNPWVSTIRVDQYKAKFDHVCVYCELADTALVAQKWAWLKANDAEPSKMPSKYTMQVDLSSEIPTAEFNRRCILRDAMHYRTTHFEMVELVPQLRGRLQWSAVYSELLHSDLDTCLRALADEAVARPQFAVALRRKYMLGEEDDVVALMERVYQPTMKQRLELMG